MDVKKHSSSVIIVAITGATGFNYGVEALKLLKKHKVETHLVISPSAKRALLEESPDGLHQAHELANKVYAHGDLGAPISSGSFVTAGMLIAPCTAKTLAEIASGIGSNLVARAADVTLKERRKLVLMVRETPLNLIHIRNMETVTEAGAVVMPPCPGFYNNPKNLNEIIRYTVARSLDLFDIDGPDIMAEKRWK